MEKIKFRSIVSFTFLLMSVILAGCSSKPISVRMMETASSEVMVVDESLVTETRDMLLSDIAEEFRVVRFENRDEAFFQPGMPAFSDNYIAVGKKPVKLFTRDGKYLCDIGAVGNGPGEYFVGAYDVLIDEPSDRIYVAGFGNKINCYDLRGNFIGVAKLNKPLNKGKLFLNSDSTVSAVQLCFREDNENTFVAANFSVGDAAGDTVCFVYAPQLAVNSVDEEGRSVGFNHELWSFRCSPRQTFHTTFNDTLYHYNAPANRLEAVFKLDMTPERRDGAFFVYQELPAHVFSNIVGGVNKGTIVVDKQTREAWRAGRKVNDYFFDLKWGWSFHDGYMFDVFEPLELLDKLQKAIDEGDISSTHREAVEEFMSTLSENDNNIMLVARLKEFR